jgi:hypothetical protein
MNYTYAGKSYTLKLNDYGQIECPDLDLRGETVNIVKAKIREQEEREKSFPRVNILVIKEEGYNNDPKLLELTSNLKEYGRGYYSKFIWVSGKDDKGKVFREKISVSYVYADTPENREKIKQYLDLKKQANEFFDKAKEIKSDLICVLSIKV